MLESRLAEHNIENLVIVPASKQQAVTTTNAQAHAKLHFSQFMTQAALRRSNLKFRGHNSDLAHGKNSQPKASDLDHLPVDLKVGGTKKDLNSFQTKNVLVHQQETASRMTVKLVETEREDRTENSILAGGPAQARAGGAASVLPAQAARDTALLRTQNSSEGNLFGDQKMVQLK